ncbi:MAG: hypothetical protein FJ405_16255 [Verrucomicrobia bacterium]|nr:hypothetical protein [Verrucomicrobiota bacterium]
MSLSPIGLVLVILLSLHCTVLVLRGGTLPVLNPSFELPHTNFVDIRVFNWNKSPKPAWYDESFGFFWTQLTGVFANTDPSSADHISNCHGSQGLWLFAVPEVGLAQNLDPSQARLRPGFGYSLTVGVIGMGGAMKEGVPLELSLHGVLPEGQPVLAGASKVINSEVVFPNRNRFVDHQVVVPVVHTSDPWAGLPIRLLFRSLADFENQGGYWALDHVRLEEAPLRLTGRMLGDSRFELTLDSIPGAVFHLLSAAAPTTPIETWANLGTLSNATGSVKFIDQTASGSSKYYCVQAVSSEL